ncbi:MAG: hypothetical protein ACSHYF_18120 [Verrucomicrobiaceae bacterium]
MERDDYSEALYDLGKRRRMRRKLDLLLRAYSLMGLLMAILAGGYFLVSLLPELTKNQQMALMFSGVGIALALMSRTLLILRREREAGEVERMTEYESVASFLDTWARFERISKEALSKEGEEFNRHSLRSVISRLHEDGKLDSSDVLALEEALQTRNLIVHGERPFSTKIAQTVTDSLLDIIKKIAISQIEP